MNKTTGEEPRNKAFQRRGQRLLQLEGFSPLIDGRGAKLTPIQIVDPRKIGSYPENFGQLKRQDINCCSPMISIIMAPRSKRMPITNFEKSGQPIHQLSASSAIFTSLQEIYINESDCLLLTSIKSEARKNPSTAPFSRFSFVGSYK